MTLYLEIILQTMHFYLRIIILYCIILDQIESCIDEFVSKRLKQVFIFLFFALIFINVNDAKATLMIN